MMTLGKPNENCNWRVFTVSIDSCLRKLLPTVRCVRPI